MANCRNCGKKIVKPFAKVFCSKSCCGTCHNRMRGRHTGNHYGCVEVEHLKIIDYTEIERKDIIKSVSIDKEKHNVTEYY